MRRARLGQRGVALMLVLWLIVILGGVAAGIGAATRSEANLASNLRARTTARYGAESGVAAATARLERLLVAARTPAAEALVFARIDRHFEAMRDVRLGPAHFGVVVVDLNGRLDLNQADESTLYNFFLEFTDEDRAARIVAALEDWTDPDDVPRPNGAEAAEYERAGSPFVPRNGPMQRVDELAHVAGVGDELALRVAPYVTVNGDGRINLNTAPESVLAALPGVGPAGAQALAARRAAGEVFTSAVVVQDLVRAGGGAAGAIALSRISVVPSRILVVSRGWQDGHPLTHEVQAVYGVAGGRLVLQSWRERDL